ncbi:MAG: hypothetical protein KDB22_20820 [Planctomycetales bacterium]|nr:hypothetical protein [Planctomycetales bacterium]
MFFSLLWAIAFLCVEVKTDAGPDLLDQYRADATTQWEKTIQELEARDRQEKDPDHAILFLGSSSIRRWNTIEADMKPWPAIQRGYGGARYSDLAVFAHRLVRNHRFDALVIFVGNDIAGNEKDKSPEQVQQLCVRVVKEVRRTHASQPIFFVAVTPTSSRFQVWPQIQQANALIAKLCSEDDKLHFIQTHDHFLNEAGAPNDALFVDDKLHLNEQGYEIWASLIKGALSKVLDASGK